MRGMCWIAFALSPLFFCWPIAAEPLAPILIEYIGPSNTDEGLAGARLAISDNQTTGRFVGLSFALDEHYLDISPESDGNTLQPSTDAGFIVANLPAEALRAVSSASKTSVTAVFNIAARDDALRQEQCLPNLLHTAPSRAMLTDGLAQYLVWKQWRRWFLVIGPTPADHLYADAVRNSAKKFGAQIVAEKEWTFRTVNARADTGHVTLQTEIPALTRVADHDVLVVADEADEFGEYLLGRTTLPRAVAGTHGMVATIWDASNEQWGAMQIQDRFRRRFSRPMTAVDYAAWLAVRAVGEAALRTKSADPKVISDYLRGPDFALSGYKGRSQSFRSWDGQMRQPILITGPKLLISASPQPGFLHRTSELDTLGVDQPESRCKQ
jgi:ABC transporter substrate binding protein (PQQ-dependent alcohol dehydrogenase system)